MTKKKNPSREKLLTLLDQMPMEAFSWLLLTLAHIPGRGQIWPDGLGGFQDESRKSIKAVEAEAMRMAEAEAGG
jgi:hypothetical protein